MLRPSLLSQTGKIRTISKLKSVGSMVMLVASYRAVLMERVR